MTSDSEPSITPLDTDKTTIETIEQDQSYVPFNFRIVSWKNIRIWISQLRRSPNTALAIVSFAFYIDHLLILLCVPVLPIYGEALHLSPVEIGFLFAGKSIMQVFANPVMGWLSDRIGRRRPMFLGLLLLGASTILFGVATNYPVLVLARLFQGLAASANTTSGFALLADSFPDKETRGKKMSIAIASLSLGVLMGAPLGGVLYSIGGVHFPFLFVGCLVLLDAIARGLFLVEPPRHVESSDVPVRPLKDAVIGLLTDVQILAVVLSLFLGNFLISMMELTTPLYLSGVLEFDVWTIGLIYGINPLMYTLTAVVINRIFSRRFLSLFWGLIFMGISSILLLLRSEIAWYIGIWTISGIGMAMIDCSANPELADISDRRHPGCYGKIYAISDSATGIGFILGPILGSVTLERMGFYWTWVILGLPLVAFAPLVLCGFGFTFKKDVKDIKLEEMAGKEVQVDVKQDPDVEKEPKVVPLNE